MYMAERALEGTLSADYGDCFAVAHCNFRLRGEESDGDERFVRQWCEAKGIRLHCRRFDTIDYSERNGVSMEMAARIDKPVIFAVGNAPTALIQIDKMMRESNWRPAFVIGVPVGFVNVEAAKELMIESDVPYIVNRGRKGGSNIAAAICNALLYGLTR